MAKIVLIVKGMSCSHCVHAVEKAVKSLDGVAEASVDLGKGIVTVEFVPSRATVEGIKKAIIDAGYEVA
jgi:copper chaperone